MKALPWVIVGFLLMVCVAIWFRPHESQEIVKTETKIRTVVRVDTQLVSAPIAVFWRFMVDTIHVGDTVVRREQVIYQDSSYKAWVSGFRPRLDKLELYPRTITHTVTNDIYHNSKRKRWGIGVQAGYGYPNGWYIGVGVSYNLWKW